MEGVSALSVPCHTENEEAENEELLKAEAARPAAEVEDASAAVAESDGTEHAFRRPAVAAAATGGQESADGTRAPNGRSVD